MKTDLLGLVLLLLGAAVALTAQQKDKPKPGVSTPGVRIPMSRLKPDAVFDIGGTPDWLAIDEDVWVSNKPKDSVTRMSPAGDGSSCAG